MNDVNLASFWYRSSYRSWRWLMAIVVFGGCAGSWFLTGPIMGEDLGLRVLAALFVALTINSQSLKIIKHKRAVTPILPDGSTLGQMAARIQESRMVQPVDIFLIMKNLYYVAVTPVALIGAHRALLYFENSMTLQAVSIGMLVLGVSITSVWVKRYCDKMHTKSVQKTENEILQNNRVGIGYLRSLDVDKSFCSPRAGKTAMSSLGVKPNSSFEATFFGAIAGYGGAGVAIGGPGEQLPPVGFWRIYCNDEDWQSQANDLMRKARVILISVNTTRSMEWVLAQLNDKSMLDKVILLFPPAGSQAQTERLDFVVAHVAAFDGLSIGKYDPAASLLCAYLNEQGKPVGVYGFTDEMLSFGQALTVALFELDRRLPPGKT